MDLQFGLAGETQQDRSMGAGWGWRGKKSQDPELLGTGEGQAGVHFRDHRVSGDLPQAGGPLDCPAGWAHGLSTVAAGHSPSTVIWLLVAEPQ